MSTVGSLRFHHDTPRFIAQTKESSHLFEELDRKIPDKCAMGYGTTLGKRAFGYILDQYIGDRVVRRFYEETGTLKNDEEVNKLRSSTFEICVMTHSTKKFAPMGVHCLFVREHARIAPSLFFNSDCFPFSTGQKNIIISSMSTASFTPSPVATISASALDSITLLCPKIPRYW